MGDRMTRDEYVERVTGWMMPGDKDPELDAEARAGKTLDGVYTGKSERIARLVRLAYLRGCRRGASCAWAAAQPVVPRVPIRALDDKP